MKMFTVKLDGNYFIKRLTNDLIVLSESSAVAKTFTEQEADEFCKNHDGFEKEFAHNVITINKIEL